eukprot:COSAG01_NODE_62020_length_286_cov_1.925134_1_plen_52_part_00
MVLQAPTEAIAVAEGADVFALPQSLLSELQNGSTGYANAHIHQEDGNRLPR